MATSYVIGQISRGNRNLAVLTGMMALAAATLIVVGTTSASGDAQASALVWAGIFALVALGAGGALALRLPAPAKHPAWRRATTYGDPEAVQREIDSEVMAATTTRLHSLTITPHWLLRRRLFGLDLARLDDLMWAYRADTRHYMNGIRTGKTVEVTLHLRDGRRWKLNARRIHVANAILDEIKKAAPWVQVGYSEELELAWEHGLESWIEEIDQRRVAADDRRPSTAAQTSSQAVDASPRPLPSDRANVILWMGVAGLLIPVPCALVAWVLGQIERREIAAGTIQADPAITVGWMLGIVGTVGYSLLMLLVALVAVG